MYYLVDKRQLPERLQRKPFETVPDGRVIITEFEMKTTGHLTGVETFNTYRDLKVLIDNSISAPKKKGGE